MSQERRSSANELRRAARTWKPSLGTGLLSAVFLTVMGFEEPVPKPIPADTLVLASSTSAPLGAEDLAAANSATDEQVALGRRLFFDPILSADRSMACASCHRPEFAMADDQRFSSGHAGRLTKRNVPSLWNKGLSRNLMWDGRAATLETQVLMPIEEGTELGLGVAAAVQRLQLDARYAGEFKSAYDGEPSRELLARALADFLRALVVADSPVDRFRAGESDALTGAERAGMWLYEGRGGCWRCHSGPNFSDESFHNTGIGSHAGEPERGLAATTSDETDRGKFRTPGLRLLARSAPYMHDGSLATLEDVVEFYRSGGRGNSNLSPDLRPLELSETDAANLVAFLRALSR